MNAIDQMRGAVPRKQTEVGLDHAKWAPEPIPPIHLYLFAAGVVMILIGLIGKIT